MTSTSSTGRRRARLVFYSNAPGAALRFGDVVQGYVTATPELVAPLDKGRSDGFRIHVDRPDLLVVLSPCCSIGDKVVLLAPLNEIRPTFLKNPYFAEDLTRINRTMRPEDAIPPTAWQQLGDAEKLRRLAEGATYAFVELFCYAPHDLFPKYPVNRREGRSETRARMIDFRHVFRLTCGAINTPTDAPVGSKLLELSIDARSELRAKIAHFYQRVPDEDLAELEE